ncbi:MAG: TetR/AcrR family transcriptional regulator [Lentilactobacillus hilgardii]|jgi:AcrR family transcriptional regulator|uniref:TetR/AcrR family transcriptional regulator n=1 Tax=Lentilactobacillus hilgardii TaxID=1588 RepID=UPI001CC1E758|nr:TetR/AcrR family transcriptional regulator [Lentilactobacillus hilgardii]MBZ2200387.1 transcriptional regulator [Lentilactobacillus hilgardii]MBZ2203595.1 TetR/AcrR family transcriptional regulator [Lentilactobacillus hilgardii]MCI2018028.1 TetR/AcrR family transcriptional regulator [Lentilactobacillus buchneri]MCV3740085.1 TetR/AcrR family transcriptional regulator [Lentilactobacillus hilgardii]
MSPKELKDQKLTDIFKALMGLLKDQSFEEISITELAKRAGVSRAYYYKNFVTLEDIVSQYEMLRIISYLRQLPDGSRLTLQTLMTHYFQLVLDDQRDQLILISAGKEQVLIKTFHTVLVYLLKNKLIPLTDRTTDSYWGDYFSGAVINLSISWLKQGAVEPPEYMGKKVETFAN